MIKFSKELIDQTRDQFKDEGFPEERFLGTGLVFNYFVIPQHKNPGLLDFAIRVTGEPKDGYVIGVSDSLPQEFRGFWAAHEYVEFMRIGIDKLRRCVTASKRELGLLPEDEKFRADYVARRAVFFNNLISYAEKNPQGFTGGDVGEFKMSLDLFLDYLTKRDLKKLFPEV